MIGRFANEADVFVNVTGIINGALVYYPTITRGVNYVNGIPVSSYTFAPR